MAGKAWSEEDVARLVSEYPFNTNTVLATKYNRSLKSVEMKALTLKLTKSRPSEYISGEHGRLTVIDGSRSCKIILLCECGQIVVARADDIRRGKVVSCGCYRADRCSKQNYSHGLTSHRRYSTWIGMLSRCYKESNVSFSHYGDRGIMVCDEWNPSVVGRIDAATNFLLWCDAQRPSDSETIERKDNNGPYSPQNCCFASNAEQHRNTSRTRQITAFGETKCVLDWSLDARCLVSQDALHWRLNKGWPAEKVITQPPYKRN